MNTGKSSYIIGGIIFIVALVALVLWYNHEKQAMLAIGTFEECAENGYPILESYPAQCKTPDGRTFVQNVATTTPLAIITVTNPSENEAVSSPLTVTGSASGIWYFEASFPIRLEDANGKVLVQTHVDAQSDWMTTEQVPFTATLTFANPSTTTGVLILEKDIPSGLPEHAAEFRVPVTFAN